MNAYMSYEIAKWCQADILGEVRRSPTIRFLGRWTGVGMTARQRLAAVAHLLTDRTGNPDHRGDVHAGEPTVKARMD